MTLLYCDPVFLEHDTGDYLQCAERIIPVVRHLHVLAFNAQCKDC
jgi:hypothetical protein